MSSSPATAAAAGPARAILVGVDLGGRAPFDESLDELALLAESAGDAPVARVIARRKAPDPALFVGSGKADEIKALVEGHRAEAVLFDQALSPAQQRNLERHLGVAVADRTMLILEIFAARAKSHEGKLQVELARLQYLATRLVRRCFLTRSRRAFTDLMRSSIMRRSSSICASPGPPRVPMPPR